MEDLFLLCFAQNQIWQVPTGWGAWGVTTFTFPEHARHIPATGPLHLPFPLPRILFHRDSHQSFPHLSLVLVKCHLLHDAFLDQPVESYSDIPHPRKKSLFLFSHAFPEYCRAWSKSKSDGPQNMTCPLSPPTPHFWSNTSSSFTHICPSGMEGHSTLQGQTHGKSMQAWDMDSVSFEQKFQGPK